MRRPAGMVALQQSTTMTLGWYFPIVFYDSIIEDGLPDDIDRGPFTAQDISAGPSHPSCNLVRRPLAFPCLFALDFGDDDLVEEIPRDDDCDLAASPEELVGELLAEARLLAAHDHVARLVLEDADLQLASHASSSSLSEKGETTISLFGEKEALLTGVRGTENGKRAIKGKMARQLGLTRLGSMMPLR